MTAVQAKAQEETDRARRRENAIADGSAMECGCCFDNEAPVSGTKTNTVCYADNKADMAACPEGHLFCHDCLATHAETKLGDQQTIIACMSMDGCLEVFTDTTLGSVLSDKTMSLYHRLRQLKDLEMAEIDGLESCPFCPFAIVIENPDEKLFHCLNDACKKVTCRNCKRPVSLTLTCKETDPSPISPSAVMRWTPTTSLTGAMPSKRPCPMRSCASAPTVPSLTSRRLVATR